MVDCNKCKNFVYEVTPFGTHIECSKDLFDKLGNNIFKKPDKCSVFENKEEGKKYDTGKNRMGLMCENFSRALWKVGEVSTFGANKYSDNSWQNLSNPKSRYMDALCRHLFQHLQGKKIDNESGLLHLQHVCWNALALLEFELKESEESNEHK